MIMIKMIILAIIILVILINNNNNNNDNNNNNNILSTILFPSKSPVASAVFGTAHLETVLQHIFLFLLQYPLIFYHIYHQIFSQMTKSCIL